MRLISCSPKRDTHSRLEHRLRMRWVTDRGGQSLDLASWRSDPDLPRFSARSDSTLLMAAKSNENSRRVALSERKVRRVSVDVFDRVLPGTVMPHRDDSNFCTRRAVMPRRCQTLLRDQHPHLLSQTKMASENPGAHAPGSPLRPRNLSVPPGRPGKVAGSRVLPRSQREHPRGIETASDSSSPPSQPRPSSAMARPAGRPRWSQESPSL